MSLVESRTKEQLMKELEEMRQRVTQLETLESEHKQVEEALRQSEKRFKDITDNTLEWVWETDANGKYTYASPVCEKILGYKPEELLGKHFYDLFSPEEREQLKEAALEVFAKKQPFRGFINQNMHKNGEIVWLSTSGVPILDERGNLLGYRGADTDITEHKQVEEALRKAEQEKTAILDSMSEIVVFQDMEHRLIWANRVAGESINLAPEQLVGRYCYEIWHKRSQPCVGCPVAKAREMEQPQASEMTTPDGRVWFVRGYPVRDANGDIAGLVESALDITERKHTEEALQESEAQKRAILDGSPDGIRQVDTNLRILWANKATLDMNPNALGQPCYKAMVNKGKPCEGCPSIKAIETGQIETGVMYQPFVVGVQGEYYCEHTGVPIKDDAGEVIGVIQITRNITEGKKVEEELKLRVQLLDGATDSIFLHDFDGNFVFVNEAACRTHGYSREELMKMKLHQVIAPERVSRLDSDFQEMLEKGQVIFKSAHLRKDGSIMPVEVHGRTIESGGRKLLLTVIRDITKRKQAEEALRESEEFSSSLLNNSPNPMLVINPDTSVRYVNLALERLTGFSSAEIIGGKAPYPWWTEETLQKTGRDLTVAMRKGAVKLEKLFQKKDGERFWVEITSTPVRSNGEFKYHLANWVDITERKQAEEALQESEEKYRSLVNHVKLGIFRSTSEPNGRFLEVNPAMGKITGYSRKELLQMNVTDLYVHPEEREPVLEEIASASGKTTKELRFRKKDGTEIVVSDTKVAVRDDAGKVLYFDGIMEDITERKRAEEREKQLRDELYLSSRLAAIGELAAGVAHELNNPLTGIVGFSERLLRKSTIEKGRLDLERIHNEAQRAARVVRNLLTFARRRQPKKVYVDINDIVLKALELRAYELKTSNIEVVTGLAPSLPETMADNLQIQEVFLNIILNAEQAITEANRGGKLGIKTRQVKSGVRISFTDDGPGIPAEHLGRLFDPFFTTRGARGGTGLGLSVCHGIVTEHGGRIYAKSKPGEGATFFVELPLTTEGGNRLLP